MNGEKKMDKDEKIALLSAIFLCLIALGMIAVFFAQETLPTGYTHIYLAPGSYDSSIDHGLIIFTFVLENMEETGAAYEIEYFFGSQRLSTETVVVQPGQKAEFERALSVQLQNPILPVKFSIRARNSFGKTYSLWFWIRKTDYS